MAPVLVTLNDLEGHSPVVGLFKCNPWNTCAVFYQILTDSMLGRSVNDSWASCYEDTFNANQLSDSSTLALLPTIT